MKVGILGTEHGGDHGVDIRIVVLFIVSVLEVDVRTVEGFVHVMERGVCRVEIPIVGETLGAGF